MLSDNDRLQLMTLSILAKLTSTYGNSALTMRPQMIALIFVLWFSATLSADERAQKAGVLDFETQVAPILEKHCIRCHYAGAEKGGISLSTVDDLRDGSYLEHDLEKTSYLVDLLVPHDGNRAAMPKDGDPLSDADVAVIREWVRQGADWPDGYVVHEPAKGSLGWWAFQPLRRTPPGRVNALDRKEISSETSAIHGGLQMSVIEGWSSNRIDDYILAELEKNLLIPNPPAERRDLIRRLSYDLTGLPPTPEEVQHFVDDPNSDAYEQLVDRLLGSPAYGERWGRHWLDVVRFGESTGYERNVIIDNAWPFRDYVIRSLNQDKPLDQLVREHLAGDSISDDPDVSIGSAFLVNGPYDNVGNQDPVQAAQIRANTIDEIVRASSEAFLGLTVGCARCHDHKFDPILQKDYYQMAAVFSGVQHGNATWASQIEKQERSELLGPLNEEKSKLEQEIAGIEQMVRERAGEKSEKLTSTWSREAVDRLGTEERFEPVLAKWVRLRVLSRDDNPKARAGFRLDEFEVWSDEDKSRNVALAENGSEASGPSRKIEDFPGAYSPHLAIDGQFGRSFLAASDWFQVELAVPTRINRVYFSSARNATTPGLGEFTFVGDYRLEISLDGESWREIANSEDRSPPTAAHRNERLFEWAISQEERQRLRDLRKRTRGIQAKVNAVPRLKTAWIGTRNKNATHGPFFVHLGGDPQRQGEPVEPASLSTLEKMLSGFVSDGSMSEGDCRFEFARWVTSDQNALFARVQANRVWHYHFGTGLVASPSDFGYMGQQPSHPELLDYLAADLIEGGWSMKRLQRQIVLSSTYRQSSKARDDGLELDSTSRLLWRFPPRRLSSDEIRDSLLVVSGELDRRMGGAGFRLYRYLQDNVATYVPLDHHGVETYRRSVYHQNARACSTDLLTEFDQPDCAFSTPRRVSTTTPLQALTALNHQFTVALARAFALRLQKESDSLDERIEKAFSICFCVNRHNQSWKVRRLSRQATVSRRCAVRS
ncbi:MAG: DUF1553 domain-containing protein [Aureliella sp.]